MSGGVCVQIKVGGFETVNRDGVSAAIDVNSEEFVSFLHDWVWSIVWWLQWSSDSIMSDENMRSSGQIITDIALPLSRTRWMGSNDVHARFEIRNEIRWVR